PRPSPISMVVRFALLTCTERKCLRQYVTACTSKYPVFASDSGLSSCCTNGGASSRWKLSNGARNIAFLRHAIEAGSQRDAIRRSRYLSPKMPRSLYFGGTFARNENTASSRNG